MTSEIIKSEPEEDWRKTIPSKEGSMSQWPGQVAERKEDTSPQVFPAPLPSDSGSQSCVLAGGRRKRWGRIASCCYLSPVVQGGWAPRLIQREVNPGLA